MVDVNFYSSLEQGYTFTFTLDQNIRICFIYLNKKYAD
jgi:hypothetical protein